MRFLRGLILLFVLTAAARAADPLHLQLPPDTLVFLELDPSAKQAAGSPSALLDLGIEALQSTGMLSKKAGELGDIFTLASEAGNHHSCLALLDADLAATGRDLECRSVQVAWIIDTSGQSSEMVGRLTRLLAQLSSRKTAQQFIRKSPESKREYVEFRDTTWPAWLTLDWTQQGRLFILTLGNGAMDHFLADRPVGGVPWQQPMIDADAGAARRNSAGDVFARVYVAAGAFRDRFPEPMQRTLLGKLFSTLDLAGTESAIFSARLHDRAISMDNATVAGGRTTDIPWTVPLPGESPLLKLVPPEATAYLALDIQWQSLFTRLGALLAASLPEASGKQADELINDFAAEHNVNIQADILAHLQPIVVIHDAPRHPLRLPLMVTIIGAADPVAAGGVKKSFQTLMTALAADLDRKAGILPNTASSAAFRSDDGDFTHLRVRTEKDEITYLQFGLVGPAWIWVDNRFVFSWSPAAVRGNIAGASVVSRTAFSSVP